MASIYDNFGPTPLLQPLGLFDSGNNLFNNYPVYTDIFPQFFNPATNPPAQTSSPAPNAPSASAPAATTPPPPASAPTNPYTLSPLNQNWMKANEGGWGDDLMKFMLGGGGSQLNFDPMNIQWTNFSTGEQENITRALGILQAGGANSLAKILGGTVENSPFATFGTQQRDQMIRMPNGQMIDASAFANALKGASQSANPFSALSDVIGLYQRENTAFNPQKNTDAVNLVNQGVLNPNTPPGWNPSKFAGGNPTFTPSGPVPGNPSNPGMGTSNPVQFQGGQINSFTGSNGFPVFNTTGSIPTQPSAPQQTPQFPQFPGLGMPQQAPPAAPQGMNTNWQYYTPQGRQENMFGNQGLYAQGMTGAGGGGGGNISYGAPSVAGSRNQNGVSANNPFGTPRNPNSQRVAGRLPNGSTVIGNR